MAYLLSGERPAAAVISLSTFRLFGIWFARAREARAQRRALAALLSLDDSRLDDLGLSRQDILDAAQVRTGRGARLAAIRARRAREWLSRG